MAQDKRSRLAKLIAQAFILVSLVSFFFSGHATAGGGGDNNFQKMIRFIGSGQVPSGQQPSS
ncbi:MAG: hypothetical protein AB7W16_21115 [Candidatus Obscuribacterales bacterium]